MRFKPARPRLRGRALEASRCQCAAGGEQWTAELLVEAAQGQLLDWRQECMAVQAAFEGWMRAARRDRAAQYARYRQAVDREEEASAIYRRLMNEVGHHPLAARRPDATVASIAHRAAQVRR